MDDSKRLSRDASHYHGRGKDPTNVPRRREQEEAARFFQLPGTRTAGNPLPAKRDELEMAQQQQQVYENLYRDGRGTGIPGTGVNYQRVKPTAPQGLMLSPQQPQDAERQQELRWAGQLAGPPGPLWQQPSDIAMDPGIAATAPRGPNGEVGAGFIPPNQPAALEDLRYSQTPMPADADAMVTGMVLGDPSQASLPRPSQSQSLYSSFGTPSLAPR